MKKYIVALGVIIIFGGYFLFSRKNNTANTNNVVTPPAPTTTATASASDSGTTTTSPASGSGTPPTTTTTTPPVAQGQYKDGSYTTPVENAYFGNLQFQVAISGGKISDVTFLQTPNANQHSIDVNNQSTPILKSEAIAAQSANVNIVSGATQTSQAFQQGLTAVLAQAKN